MTGPAVPSDEELREAIVRSLRGRGIVNRDWRERVADDFLALPEVAALLAAAEKVRQMWEAHQPVPAMDVGAGGDYPRDMCSCGESFYDDCEIRRALDGQP